VFYEWQTRALHRRLGDPAPVAAMQSIEAIILAGGSGSRFGGGKLLAPYRSGALIDGAIHAAMSAPVHRVILVTGHDADRVGDAAARLAAQAYPKRRFDVVFAERHAEGMAFTLKTGVAALSDEAKGAFVFLGDMPDIPLPIPALLAAHLGGRSAAAPVYKGKRGHPVLFAARLFPALLTLSGDQGARKILDTLGEDLALLDVDDPGVLFDVDHRSDVAS
jgi:molybdenum cofactor cytidylyltransferase